jgi:hypothetical protein
MSRILMRAGGLSAVIAAVLIVVQQVWTVVVTGPIENLPDSVMYTIQLLFMVFGVIGIAVAQQSKAGRFAQFAALTAVLGCVSWFAASETEVTYLPTLTATGSPLLDNPPRVLVIIYLISFVTFVVGLLSLSVSIVVTRVLPWRAAVVLGGGLILGLTLGSVVPGILAVYAIGLGWLGVACVKAANETPSTGVEAAPAPAAMPTVPVN